MRLRSVIVRGILLLPILLVLLYLGWTAYEDFAGPREWQATLAYLQAKGDPTDFQTLVPPPIPDADNLAAIPLFQLEPDPETKSLEPLKLEAAFQTLEYSRDNLPNPKWSRGERADAAEFAKFLADSFRQTFPKKPFPTALLDQFDALCPVINELRQASATRSECRFAQDYTSYPPFARSLGSITEMILVAKFINLHALTALQAGRAPVALDDINLALKLDAGLRKEPILVSGLVAIAVAAIQSGAIWEGLESHAWNDAQLAALQHELAQIDFLSNYQLAQRGEAIGFFAPIMDYMHDRPAMIFPSVQLIQAAKGDTGQADSAAIQRFLGSLIPRGCFDSTKARGVTLYTDAARDCVDVNQRRVFPEKYAAILMRAEKRSFSFPGLLLHMAAPPVVRSTPNFCEAQFRVDTARIACMIERYRLAHGLLPTSLEQLVPFADKDGIPLDLCNGQPYHFSLRPDGTYLLYSIGWNGVDDDGKVVYKPDDTKRTDPERGDWVWPQPGHPGT